MLADPALLGGGGRADGGGGEALPEDIAIEEALAAEALPRVEASGGGYAIDAGGEGGGADR